jgi:hypothetical protein
MDPLRFPCRYYIAKIDPPNCEDRPPYASPLRGGTRPWDDMLSLARGLIKSLGENLVNRLTSMGAEFGDIDLAQDKDG